MSKQVILFTSQGCGPCKTIEKEFPNLRKQYGVDTIIHEIDWRSEEGKNKTADFKNELGLPQSFATPFTPGLVVREIPSGAIIGSADGGNANMNWLIFTLESNPNQFDLMSGLIPDSIASSSLFSSFGSTQVSDGILLNIGANGESSKNQFSDIFDMNNPASVFLIITTLLIFFIAIYQLYKLKKK